MLPTVARKSLALMFDSAQEGAFKARIATLAPTVDKDGDVTLPGAVPDGKRVLISAYMHKSWDGMKPVGDGVVSSDSSGIYIDGKFWLNTTDGLDTYNVVKNAGDLQQWSYGYSVLDSAIDSKSLEAYPGAKQVLKSLDILEVSPVLIGAGEGTGTMAIKSGSAKARAMVAKLKAGTLDSAMVAAIARIDALTDELDDAVDALMVTAGIPDPDEDEEASEANVEGDQFKGVAFADHGKRVLADAQSFVVRAKSLADLRAKKSHKAGRVLSDANRTRLDALHAGLTAAATDLRDLLDSSGSTSTSDTLDSGAAEKAAAELAAIWLDVQRRNVDLIGF